MRRTGLALLFILALAVGPVFGPSALAQDGPLDPTALNQHLYIPAVLRGGPYILTGKVTDAGSHPLAAVVVRDQAGRTAVTAADGTYTLLGLPKGAVTVAPDPAGYRFTPSMATVQVTGSGARQDFQAQAACYDLVKNGGFETVSAWEIPNTPFPAGYSKEFVRSGSQSARTGITNKGDNRYAYSAIRQAIAVPAGLDSATLRVWLYPLSGESAMAPAPAEPEILDSRDRLDFSSQGTDANDAQYVVLLDANDEVIQTLMWTRSNNRQWTLHEFNVAKWAGRTIQVEIGVYNDGLDGVTSLFVDDVSLEACPGTSTEPPTATCGNRLNNSGFESGTAWNIPTTPYMAGYSVYRAHTGARSMRTGIVYASDNVESYSDAWQALTIPADATKAKLNWWYFPMSTEAASLNGPQIPLDAEAFGNAPMSEDAQYVLIVWWDSKNVKHIDYPFWIHSNSQAWTNVQIDLLAYKGMTVHVQFGSYNNGTGGVTALYVDDMLADICSGATPPPPTTCTERAGNGGFESTASWYIPTTAFSAGYSTDRAHAGSRSMRAGILFAAHNRYSYSDFRQTIAIPTGITSAKLSMWLFPQSGEPAGGGDVQYLLILDADGNWIDTLIWQRSSSAAWTYREFDLKAYAGLTIKIQFGVYNDGAGGVTSMYVDDVSLVVCP